MGIEAEAECVCVLSVEPLSIYKPVRNVSGVVRSLFFFLLVLNSPDLLHILLSFLHITSCDVTGLITSSR